MRQRIQQKSTRGRSPAASNGTTVAGRLSPIQRYKTGNPVKGNEPPLLETEKLVRSSPYSVAYGSGQTTFDTETDSYSHTQSEKFTGNTETTEAETPELKISGNDAIAIHHTDAQPKEFFAEQFIIDSSNDKLEKADAAVRLVPEGGGLKVEGNENTLHRVVPFGTKNARGEDDLKKLTRFYSSECNQVLGDLIGSSNLVMVMAREAEDQGTEAGRMPQGPQDSWIRSYLAEGKPNPEGLEEHLRTFRKTDDYYEKEETAAERYHELPPEERDQQAVELGLNEHAMPDVGEGYLVNSQNTKEFKKALQSGIPVERYTHVLQELEELDPKLDIAGQKISEEAKTLMNMWGRHYATVVARDGEDSVTLENYNRQTEKDFIIREIFNNLVREFEEFRTFVGEQTESISLAISSDQATELINKAVETKAGVEEISAKLERALDEAKTTIDTGLKSQQEYQASLLHFQMYGPGEQSFHAAFRSMTSDPLTIRLRNSVTWKKEALEKKLLPLPDLLTDTFTGGWRTGQFNDSIDGLLSKNLHEHLHEVLLVFNDCKTNSDITVVKKRLLALAEFREEDLAGTVCSLLNQVVPFDDPFEADNLKAIMAKLKRINELYGTSYLFLGGLRASFTFSDLNLVSYEKLNEREVADLKQLGTLLPALSAVFKQPL